jgi:hypothetical protein
MTATNVMNRAAFAFGRGVSAVRRWRAQHGAKKAVREAMRDKAAAEHEARCKALIDAMRAAYSEVNPDGPVTQDGFDQALAEGRRAVMDFIDREIDRVFVKTFLLVQSRMRYSRAEQRVAVEELIRHHFSGVEDMNGFHVFATRSGDVKVIDSVKPVRPYEDREEDRRYVIAYVNRRTGQYINEVVYNQRYDQNDFYPVYGYR